jgi:hypothetical protein
MTVVSAVITLHYTAHGSDSLLTSTGVGGRRKPEEYEETKLVYVNRWRGAFAFWGLAKSGQWSTLRWLRRQARQAVNFSSAEEFANATAGGLNSELSKLRFTKAADKGIGVHFTAYEEIDGLWIPELFLISNWAGIPYMDIRPEGVGVSREMYYTLKEGKVKHGTEHREPEFRIEVYQALKSGTMFRFNNGDPALFNPAANGIHDAFFELIRRGLLKDPNSDRTHSALAREPIQLISRLLRDFTKTETQLIGGKLHDLCISPEGKCTSFSGDDTK